MADALETLIVNSEHNFEERLNDVKLGRPPSVSNGSDRRVNSLVEEASDEDQDTTRQRGNLQQELCVLLDGERTDELSDAFCHQYAWQDMRRL